MRDAMREARARMDAADNAANGMAELLTGRLRKVGNWRLKILKRELAAYNARTGTWND